MFTLVRRYFSARTADETAMDGENVANAGKQEKQMLVRVAENTYLTRFLALSECIEHLSHVFT